MKKITILKIVSVAILVALASVLSLFDRYISSAFLSMFPTVLLIFPYFKIGIANIIILVIIYNFDFKYSLYCSIISGMFSFKGIASKLLVSAPTKLIAFK